MADRLGFEEEVLRRIDQMADPMIDAVAQRLGTPPGAKTYSTDEQLTEWNFSPIADPAQRVEAMLTLKMQGQSDEQITDAIYPNRRRLITAGRPRVDEQVKFAREMNALMRKKEAERLAQMPPPAPAMDAAPAAGLQAQPSLGVGDIAPAPTTAPPPAPAPAQPSMLDMPAMPMMMGG